MYSEHAYEGGAPWPTLTDLATAQDEIRRRVAAIAAAQWDLPTPCTGVERHATSSCT